MASDLFTGNGSAVEFNLSNSIGEAKNIGTGQVVPESIRKLRKLWVVLSYAFGYVPVLSDT